MRRLLIGVAVAALVLGVLAPASAEEPPPMEAVETTPLGVGAVCYAQKGRPFQEVIPPYAYVSSYFSVNCQPSSGVYQVYEVTATLLHRQSHDRIQFGPYSNDPSVKSRSSAGTLSFLPSRDRCNTGGAMRWYQQRVIVEVAWFNRSGGGIRRDEATYHATANYQRPCGASEPG